MAATADDQDALVFSGRFGQVRFARARSGQLMVKSDWDSQSDKWRKAFLARFMAITQASTLMLVNREMFKQVDGELYEFKHIGQKSRIFAFRENNCWYLVDTFTEKKEDDLPPGVVKRAKNQMQEAKSVLAQRRKDFGQ